jgi:hypothetical protein
MKNNIVIFSVIILCSYSLICQQTPDVDLPLTVSDNLGNSKELRYGLDPLATDGIDVILGEQTLPPMPPSGNFEARFNLLPGDESTWKDYRQGVIPYSGVKTHYIEHQAGTGATLVTFEWDMPPEVTGLLQDRYGGGTVNAPMSGNASFTTPFVGIPLKMIITYDEVLPVELTYFTTVLYEKFVKLEWTTATEVSNYGFEVEKRIDNSGWDSIGFVDGSGNSSSPKKYYFEDKNLTGGTYFQYRLKQIDTDGTYEYSQLVEVLIVPSEYELFQNYPNPFNPITVISWQSPVGSQSTLKVYDILGTEIVTLVDEFKPAGNYKIEFNADNLPTGVYFYQLKAGGYVSMKKMILLK